MELTLKACRVNVKASIKETADYVGVSGASVRNWENGSHVPSIVHAQKLVAFFNSRGFNISVNDINFLP